MTIDSLALLDDLIRETSNTHYEEELINVIRNAYQEHPIIMSKLKPETMVKYAGLVITYDGVANCFECNRPRQVYTNNTTRVPVRNCESCTRDWLVLSLLVPDLAEANHTARSTTLASFFPPSLFHTIDVRTKCFMCQDLIVGQDETVRPVYGRDLKSWTTLGDNETGTYIIHTACVSHCYECTMPGFVSMWRGDVPDSLRLRTIGGRVFCKPCEDEARDNYEIWPCESCSEDLTSDNSYEHRGYNYCDSCYDEMTSVYCENCDESYCSEEYTECPGCENSNIYSYNYKPRPTFYGSDKYYLGLELEMEAMRDTAYQKSADYLYQELGDRIYLKRDGSISYGFELVSHPHSLAQWQDKFKWDALAVVAKYGMRSWDTSSCGIHVHVGREAFKPMAGAVDIVDQNIIDRHLILFTKFIYDNQRQVERIAGRSNCSYATFRDKNRIIPKVKNNSQSSGRYSAVNLDNSATVEVRVFKGSLRKERVLSAIEFVHSVVEYTRNLKIIPKDKPLSWARYVAYIVANANKYPNLLTIINESFDNERPVNNQEDGE